MDAFVDNLAAIFVDWGYAGLFVSAFVAGSVLPFSSEIVMVVLVQMGLSPVWCVLAASAGNTLGGMTCYWLGHLGKRAWIEKYLRIDAGKIEKATVFLSGRGAAMGFFAFLPYIGEAIAIVLGFMRSNVWITSLSMFFGKMLRYVVLLFALKGVIALF